MKTLIIILTFILCQPSFLVAQTLKGTIQDASGKGVPFASVSLLKADKTIVKATSTDETGRYIFDKIETGRFAIAAFSVGFSKQESSVFELKANTLQNLVLQENTTQLNEVQVATKRPFVEQQLDRTVVNVANSIVGSGSTALEVLTKAPSVTVDFQKEQIELRGKEGVIIQIDGKQTYLSGSDLVGMLRGMSSDNIDKIEIITNPSAKYDAAGNSGIINIRLKKNTAWGTNGLLSLGAGSGVHYRTRAGLQLNHRTEKLNLFANYSGNKGQNFFELDLFRNQPDENQRNLVKEFTHLVFDDEGHNLKTGLDYTPTKNTIIGLVWTGFWKKHQQNGNASFDARRSENNPVYLQTDTYKTQNEPSENQLINFNFQQSFKNKGQLSIDLDYGKFNKDFDNNLMTQTLVLADGAVRPVPYLNNFAQTQVSIKTAKADYNVALSKLWKFETGIKIADVQTTNHIDFKTGENSSKMVLDPALSGDFKYTENVAAAYINFSGTINKTAIQLGLRAENTHSVASLSAPRQERVRDYLNWFPSVFISKLLSEKQTLIFSYSHRINRPNYQYLNPVKSYINLFTYSQGNIDQIPEYTHALELRYALKSGFSASLSANYINGFVMPVNSVIEGNKLRRLYQNIGNVNGYALTLNQPLSIAKPWQMQVTMTGFYDTFDYQYEGSNWSPSNISTRLSINNGFMFGKGWTAELNGWVNSPSLKAVEKTAWLSMVDMGLQKALSPQAKLKLSVQNVFFTPLSKNHIETPNSFQSVIFNMDSRVAMLNFSYTFGNQKVKATRQRRTGAEDESRRVN
jgi:Outer membrane protein beta-barrel family/Carboxypeptidase regulatory-like domain